MWWQKSVSDEQQVEAIRKVRTLFLRWQPVLWLFVVGIFCLWIFCAIHLVIQVERFSAVYGNLVLSGLLFGGLFFFSGLLLGIVFALILLCSTETKSWDLMLKYHDRLEQAGLLSEGAGTKMDGVEPQSSGS